MRLQVHIERLSLDDVLLTPGRAAQLQAQVVHELTRLLPGLAIEDWRPGHAIAALDAGFIRLAQETPSHPDLGDSIAGAIHRTLAAGP